MGKKGSSKGISQYQAREAAPNPKFNPKQSRINKIDSLEQVYGGDEDEFHRNRDEIIFESDGREARSGMEELSEDDEIYDLNLPGSSDEEMLDEDEDDTGVADGQDEDDDEERYEDEPDIVEPPRGRFAKSANPSQDVLSDDAASAASDAESNSEDEEETWAANSYHASRRAPGEADSEDEEALDLEADEARRLQKRARDVMGGDDFGLGDGGEEIEGELEKMREVNRRNGKLEEAIQAQKGVEVKVEGFVKEEEAIAYLLKQQPETLALLDDFSETAERMKSVEKALELVRQGEDGREHPALAIMEMEHQALSTYLPTLAFYFSLLLAPTPSAPLVKRVLSRLTSLRSALATMEELDLTAGSVDGSDSDDDDDDEDGSFESDLDDDESALLASEVWDLGQEEEEMEDDDSMMTLGDEYNSDEEEITDSMIGGLEDDELEELMADMAGEEDGDELIARVKEIQRAKHAAIAAASGVHVNGNGNGNGHVAVNGGGKEEQTKKKRSKSQRKKDAATSSRLDSTASLLDLSTPLPPSSRTSSSSKKSAAKATTTDDDDFAEQTFLSAADLSDKAARKHTLRFHVSQVHQKAMKRESNLTKIGGDDDLPRRSKERSRREVLKRQEHGGAAGEALDGEEWTEGDKKRARGNGGAEEGEDGEGGEEDYYDLVKRETKEGKVAKKVKYDDERGAAKAELDDMTDADAAGPRGATRKILANKGLQPKRAKVNRNPRVKKRLRYDKAVKKVASMKSVYKGGAATLGHGEYMGEKSGIGKSVVKSVRLGGKS